VADPVNYCSWLVKGFCITQSEWAAWTQAGFTVGTFAFAMWRQKVFNDRAAYEKKVAAQELLKEKQAHLSDQKAAEAERRSDVSRIQALRARALAIAIRSELTAFASVVNVLHNGEHGCSPRALLDRIKDHFAIRHRALDSLELLNATDIVLTVVERAERAYLFLEACALRDSYINDDEQWIRDHFGVSRPIVDFALVEIQTLITGDRNEKRS